MILFYLHNFIIRRNRDFRNEPISHGFTVNALHKGTYQEALNNIISV